MLNSRLNIIKGAEGIVFKHFVSGFDQVVYLINDEQKLDETCELLQYFSDDNVKILKLPPYDIKAYDIISPSAIIQNQRLNTLTTLANNPNDKYILVITKTALLQLLPPKKVLSKHCLEIKIGANINRESLIQHLHECGFIRLINAFHPGEFSVRGSIIDVVLTEGYIGYRIDFFGDRIESIRTFNIENQISLEKIDSVNLIPTSEVILNKYTKPLFVENVHTKIGLKANNLITMVEENRKFPGQENLLPFFYEELSDIFDFISPNAAIILPENFMFLLEEQYQEFINSYNYRQENINKTSDTIVLTPEIRFLTPQSALSCLNNMHCITYNNFVPDDNNFKPVPTFYIQHKTLNRPPIEIFKEFVKANRDKKILALCFSLGSRERLKVMLKDYDVVFDDVANYAMLKSYPKGIVLLGIAPLAKGFIHQENIFISEQDLFGERVVKKSQTLKATKEIFNEISSITSGELVVHIDHGIGRFDGIESLKIGNVTRDFIKIIYADNDKLYVPVENFELISKHGSEDNIALDKLGGANWQIRKAKLKNKIKLAAEELLKIAAQRSLAKTTAVTCFDDSYEEFCSRFPYVETPDQQNAIDDVINDLAIGRPMDRLICGDVGFGKTEVALRAAFAAVANSQPQQVAVLVPTTLLSRQHYETFVKRFDGLPITIKQLSKFTSSSEIKPIKIALAEGKIDIIIGTHALLAKDIKFKNPGLIIIDEEQHFGVIQKEKLKQLKAQTHVLTLSATPIPRTLQMSLAGVKDLSIIASPPCDRLPIKTYVAPYDAITIREAILREYYRGGKIFFICPRISYLDGIIDKIKTTIPEVKAVKAHGQMNARDLDNVMNDFYDGKYNVLVSTSIIESGLDISTANTIIIDRADMFGLAQLYQIRGRVGRSNVQAYAYLTYPQHFKLSVIAEKKLTILQSLDSLGAGFSIASHDMELRGYGNLVGDEQSGHIKEVGVELYQHMLEEEIRKVKTNVETSSDSIGDWSPVLNIGVSVQIPANYIDDSALRLSFYRRIAAINNEVELEALAIEMVDRFGKLPDQAEHLISIIKLKQIAKKANIEKVDLGQNAVIITFRNNIAVNPEKIIDLIQKNSKTIKLKPDQKLLIIHGWKNSNSIIKGIENILHTLCCA